MKKAAGMIYCLMLVSTPLIARKRDTNRNETVRENSVILLPKTDYHQYDAYDRTYYNSLVEKASKRRWACTMGVQYSSEDKGFDDNGNSASLSTTVFGTCPITIQDIYLFSRLSYDNKVRIDNCDARVPDRGGVPIGGTGVVFGGFSDDLYTTLLAPIELNFDMDQKQFSFVTNGMLRFDLSNWECFSAALGFTIPFRSVYHTIGLSYSGGELFRSGFVPDTTQRETSLRQFFREFSSVEDFINAAILAPKGLSLNAQQRQSGIGDISLFGLIEYHNDHTFEFGLNLVLPTARNGGTNFIWEPVLGNGGAYLFNPFAQFLFATNNPYLNPFVRAAIEIGPSFHTDTTRAPTLVTNPVRQQVHEVTGLSAPDTFQNFYVDPFQEFDSTVPLFGGKTPTMKKKIGPKVLFGLGNYIYELFHVDLRLGLFYDFFAKGTDSYCKNCSSHDCDCSTAVTIDTTTLEAKTDQRAHTLSANLVYKFHNYFELGGGGQFTVRGKNVSKNRGFYVSFVAVF